MTRACRVPYIANLENGRGNPTITVLARLAEALGMRLALTLVPAGERPGVGIATALDLEAGELSGRLVTAMAAFGNVVGKDLAQADWSRILGALLLVAAHPAELPVS